MLNFMGDRRRQAAVAFVDWAILAGKPIKSVRAQIIAMHMQVPGAVESLVMGLPSVKVCRS